MVDFARINRVTAAFSHDYDAYNDEVVESAAFLPLRWTSAVLEILKLPVAAWDCPTTAAGEIDTERKKDTMYGNNNGYGGPQEDHYDRMNRTKPIEDRNPFFAEGPHTVAVVSLEEYDGKDKGPTVRGTFLVLKSNAHPVGSLVTKLWFITKPAKFESQANDGDRFADFVRKLKDVKDPTYPIGQDIRKLLRDRAGDQLARGMVIDALGINTSKNPQKPYVDVRWSSMQQSPEQIAQMRAQLDANPLCAIRGPRPQQTQQYGAPQAQYQAPMQTQPQYAPPPIQQPQYAPVQGVPQQSAPTGVPQGGFLAQIPNGNTQGGGNQGGGW